MQKIINQVQDNSNIFGYVSTKKVVEILEKNKDTRKRSGKYCMLTVGDIKFIGAVSKISIAMFVIQSMGVDQDIVVSSEHGHVRYRNRKKEFWKGETKNVFFL